MWWEGAATHTHRPVRPPAGLRITPGRGGLHVADPARDCCPAAAQLARDLGAAPETVLLQTPDAPGAADSETTSTLLAAFGMPMRPATHVSGSTVKQKGSHFFALIAPQSSAKGARRFSLDIKGARPASILALVRQSSVLVSSAAGAVRSMAFGVHSAYPQRSLEPPRGSALLAFAPCVCVCVCGSQVRLARLACASLATRVVSSGRERPPLLTAKRRTG